MATANAVPTFSEQEENLLRYGEECIVQDVISGEKLIAEYKGESKIAPRQKNPNHTPVELHKLYHPAFAPEGIRWALPDSIVRWL